MWVPPSLLLPLLMELLLQAGTELICCALRELQDLVCLYLRARIDLQGTHSLQRRGWTHAVRGCAVL